MVEHTEDECEVQLLFLSGGSINHEHSNATFGQEAKKKREKKIEAEM